MAEPLETTVPPVPKLAEDVLQALEKVSVEQPITQIEDVDPIMTLGEIFGGKRFNDFLESD